MTSHEAGQVAEEAKTIEWFSDFCNFQIGSSAMTLHRLDLNRCAAGPFLW
jgi:hypothetical protein